MSAETRAPMNVKIRLDANGVRRLTVGKWLVIIAPALGPSDEPIERREHGFKITASNAYTDSTLFEDWQPDYASARDVVCGWIGERLGAKRFGARPVGSAA